MQELASGWRAAPLPGGGRTLWITSKGFRLHLHSPFQDFSCRKGRLCQIPRRRHRGGLGLSRPLQAPRRHLEQPAARGGGAISRGGAEPKASDRADDRLRRRAARLRGRAAAGCRYRVPQPALPGMPEIGARGMAGRAAGRAAASAVFPHRFHRDAQNAVTLCLPAGRFASMACGRSGVRKLPASGDDRPPQLGPRPVQLDAVGRPRDEPTLPPLRPARRAHTITVGLRPRD